MYNKVLIKPPKGLRDLTPDFFLAQRLVFDLLEESFLPENSGIFPNNLIQLEIREGCAKASRIEALIQLPCMGNSDVRHPFHLIISMFKKGRGPAFHVYRLRTYRDKKIRWEISGHLLEIQGGRLVNIALLSRAMDEFVVGDQVQATSCSRVVLEGTWGTILGICVPGAWGRSSDVARVKWDTGQTTFTGIRQLNHR